MADDEDRALMKHAGESVDPYEREHMPGKGVVLYRDKMVAGKKFNTFLAMMAGVMIAVSLGATGTLAGLVGLPILAAVWLMFGVLRVTVSQHEVDIKYGLFGPRIPVAAIESAEAIDYDWKRYGGWGIRRGPEGWMYNMMGDGGRAVRITWRDQGGKKRITSVGTKTADALAQAIQGANRALSAASDPPDSDG